MRVKIKRCKKVKLRGTPGTGGLTAVDVRILEDGDVRITEDGDIRILE